MPPIDKVAVPESGIVSVDVINFYRALDVLGEAFPDVAPSFFYAITHLDPFSKPEMNLAIEKNNRLAAFLKIFSRSILLNNQTIRVGGIGSVATRPKEQGNGYASQLLQRALEWMEQEGMQGSMLFTKINPFYERMGWVTIPQKEQEIAVSSLKIFRPTFHSYRRITEKDCGKIQSIYTEQLPHIPGLLQRTPDYWDARVQWMNHVPIVVVNGDDVIGYFYMTRYNFKEPVLAITEIGLAKEDEQSIRLLLGSMARKAEEQSCSVLRGFFRQIPALNLFLGANHLITAEKPYNYLMWKDLSGYTAIETIIQLASEGKFLYWQTDAF